MRHISVMMGRLRSFRKGACVAHQVQVRCSKRIAVSEVNEIPPHKLEIETDIVGNKDRMAPHKRINPIEILLAESRGRDPVALHLAPLVWALAPPCHSLWMLFCPLNRCEVPREC